MTYPLIEAKQKLQETIQQFLKKFSCTVPIQLETPEKSFGDFAFPCFSLAKQFHKAPQVIAQEIQQNLPTTPWIDHVEAQGGYVNIFLNMQKLTEKTLNLIHTMDTTYGQLPPKKKSVIIEHTSANPNGPLHVGRARNPIIGDTLVRIFKAGGYDVESQFYLDDMGKQVALLTWGLQHIPPKEIPKSSRKKPDHQYVGFYQRAHEYMKKDTKVEQEVQSFIVQSEQGEQNTLEQMEHSYQPVLQGIQQSLHRLNITIDRYIPESTFVKDKSVDQVVEQLKTTTYAQEDNGAWYLDLEPFGIKGRSTRFYFTRQDGTTLYATRDIAYHLWKATQAQHLINILGEDHKLESQQVRIALELLHASTTPEPVFYAFVSLPGGKMSTRRGRVVYLDDLVDECVQRAYDEVKKRRGDELTEKQMRCIAELVGTGAVRYNIIKVQPEKDMVFRWEEALNFEGNAVPFLQYAHARACGILAKNTEPLHKPVGKTLLHSTEITLLKHLSRLPLAIQEATEGKKPHLIAAYIFETASAFNQFYRDCPVLIEQDAATRNARVHLVNATRIVLRNALFLLGIDAPEEM